MALEKFELAGIASGIAWTFDPKEIEAKKITNEIPKNKNFPFKEVGIVLLIILPIIIYYSKKKRK